MLGSFIQYSLNVGKAFNADVVNSTSNSECNSERLCAPRCRVEFLAGVEQRPLSVYAEVAG